MDRQPKLFPGKKKKTRGDASRVYKEKDDGVLLIESLLVSSSHLLRDEGEKERREMEKHDSLSRVVVTSSH